MNAEYESALQAIRKATAKFTAIGNAYHAGGTVTDNEFLAARAEYKKAEKVFDVAFAKEERGA